MSRKLRLPRTRNSQLQYEILAEGEARYNLDTHGLHLGDGVKPGGDKLATTTELTSTIADAKALQAALLATGSAQVLAATLAADKAEAALIALEVTTAGAWFPSLTDPDLLALPNGEGAFVRTDDGRFLLVEIENYAPVIKVEFSTSFTQKNGGINLWEFAKGDTRKQSGASTTAGSNVVQTPAFDTFSAADVGKRIFVRGAGPTVAGYAGPLAPFVSTITEYTDPRSVKVANNASNTVAAAYMQWGTDDKAAVNFAFALAAGLGVGRVNAGGPGKCYWLGGAYETYGSFPAPGGDIPFNRHKVRLYSNLDVIGSAEFMLEAGTRYPGGVFGHPYWENNETLYGVGLYGITIDGNKDDQIVPPVPAGSAHVGGDGNAVWQHGNGVSGRIIGFTAQRCSLNNVYGYGINVGGNDALPGRDGTIDCCKFYNIFTQAAAVNIFNWRVTNNKISGPGYWVGGFTLETFDPTTQGLKAVWFENNLYDYRDGLRPPDATDDYASDSTQALAARTRTRKALSFNSPVDPGAAVRDFIVQDEIIYQGVISSSVFNAVKFRGLTIRNTYEDLSVQNQVGANAILITGYGATIYDCEVSDCLIESDLDGHGLVMGNIERMSVHDITIRYPRFSAIRLEGGSGRIHDITLEDFGAIEPNDTPIDQIGVRSSGIFAIGGGLRTLDVHHVTATDSRVGSARRAKYLAYVNRDPSQHVSRVTDCTGENLIIGVVRDVLGELVPAIDVSVYQSGNIMQGALTHAFSHRVSATRGLTATDDLLVQAQPGQNASLAMQSDAGTSRSISMITGNGLEAQLQHLADGGWQINMFDNGTYTGTPFRANNDGHLQLASDWQNPVELVAGLFLWVGSGSILRCKGARPSSVDDGSPVATQTV